jgi:hypothetical protein
MDFVLAKSLKNLLLFPIALHALTLLARLGMLEQTETTISAMLSETHISFHKGISPGLPNFIRYK